MDCKSIQSDQVWKYHAFLSFDDQYHDHSFIGFIENLTAALQRQDILTFSADRMLKTTESIPSHILETIQHSQICIVVFTKHYADSIWCLEELAKIAQGISQCIVLPIFYRVCPVKVRTQSSYYQVAFTKHEEKFRHNLDQVQRWKIAMKQVASRRCWRAWIGSESHVIDHIVKYIMKMFGHGNDLVGMKTHVKALEELLNDDDVQFVGISGMCGIGKTCVALEVYERIYHRFDAYCFLYNVGQFGLKNVYQQQRVHDSLMDDNNLEINSPHQRCCKTLLVIDNVDELQQLQFWVDYNWFGRGSKIIITTRDESILRLFGVDKIYKVELLNKDKALQLFCRHAFKCDYLVQGYEEFTHYALEYANGLPLAIQSLGSALRGQSPLEWKSFMEKLEECPEDNIMLHLKSWIVELKGNEMDLVLDVACFFNGKDESYVTRILNSIGYSHLIGIRVLQDKSLINIMNGKIWMHNLLQQVGREIVQNRSQVNRPIKSRLWLIKDYLDLKLNTLGTGLYFEAMVLNPEILEETPLSVGALLEMKHLQLLIIHNVNFIGELYQLSSKLRYVSWHKYPYTHLPLSFEGLLLVELIMPHSNITQLWKGIKTLPNLRNLDLHGSKYLMETPNFTGLPNLEELDLEGCSELLKVDSSIVALQKLKFVNLRHCISLISIPNSLFDLSSLKMLNLAGCSNLEKHLNFAPLRSSLEVKLFSFISSSKNKLVVKWPWMPN